MSDNPWWWPVVIDADWLAMIRKDYPEKAADMSDEELKDYYGHGSCWKYSDTWDHLGDAREEYEKLADAFLKLVQETGKTPQDFD